MVEKSPENSSLVSGLRLLRTRTSAPSCVGRVRRVRHPSVLPASLKTEESLQLTYNSVLPVGNLLSTSSVPSSHKVEEIPSEQRSNGSRKRKIGVVRQRGKKRRLTKVKMEKETTLNDGSVEPFRKSARISSSTTTNSNPTNSVSSSSVNSHSLQSFENVQKNKEESKILKVKSRWRRSSELESSTIGTSDHSSSDEPLVPLHKSESETKRKREETKETNETEIKGKEDHESKCLELPSLEKDSNSETQKEIDKRLGSFVHIVENRFLCDRRSTKESRGMDCDCSLSKEEKRQGNVKGCTENCLNRLLKIECGKSCSLSELCSNKKFQSFDNAKIQVFQTEHKGLGLQATESIEEDCFIMEYVGEVLSAKQFRQRARRYAQEDVSHFYFMALSSEFVIDATFQGNISRFINHSCAPNAETQKWMVNGEMRIGFFTKRVVEAGEELTFDYKYERYGQQAQKCLCESEKCRGWLGGQPENEDEDDENDDEEWSSSSSEDDELINEDLLPGRGENIDKSSTNRRNKGRYKNKKSIIESRRRRVSSSSILHSTSSSNSSSSSILGAVLRKRGKVIRKDVIEYEDEIQALLCSGIKTKSQTVELCRLMVRTTDKASRLSCTGLLRDADTPCLRLFLDYHGLKILAGWMEYLGNEETLDLDLKLGILECFCKLNIPHRTMLIDSKVWDILFSWKSHYSCSYSEIQMTEYQESESKETESNELESKQTDNKQPDIKETDIKETDIKETEIKETESNKPESKQPYNKETDIKETDIKETESKETDIKETDNKETDNKETDIKETDNKETDNKETDIKETESKENEEKRKLIVQKSQVLLSSWSSLQEVFKIPKRDRVALRVEHEREADEAEKESLQSSSVVVPHPYPLPPLPSKAPKVSRYSSFNCSKVHSESVGSSAHRISRFDDRTGLLHSGTALSKEARRHLFSLKVFQEEEEKRRRELLLESHNNKCFYLGLHAPTTPTFPHYPQFMFSPSESLWYLMPPPYPVVNVTWGYSGMAVNLPDAAYTPDDEPLPDLSLLYPPGIVPVSYFYGLKLTTPEDFYADLYSVIEEEQEQGPSSVLPRFHVASSSEPSCDSTLSSSRTKRPSRFKELTLELEDNWRPILDSLGRLYFAHKTQGFSLWEPPLSSLRLDSSLQSHTWQSFEIETASTASENTETSDDEDEDEEEDEEDNPEEDNNNSRNDEDDEDEDDEDEEQNGEDKSLENEKGDLTLLQKTLLLQSSKAKSKEERHHERRQKRERDREKREYERKRRVERHGKHKADGLVTQILIPGRNPQDFQRRGREVTYEKGGKRKQESSTSVDKSENLEKSKSDKYSEHSSSSTETSSFENEKKSRERFLKECSKVIVRVLDPYRRPETPIGQITSIEDFKHLAKKLTQFVLSKELKYCSKIEDLKCSDSVKKKAGEFVRKYMSKFGELYKRSPSNS